MGEYLEDQRAEGTSKGEGSFTIEAARARIKQARFQFVDSSHFLLKIFQSLVQTEPNSLAWTFDRKRTILEASPKRLYPQLEPTLLLQQMRGAEDSAEPARSLQIGLVAALAKDPTHVVWSRRNESGTQILTLRGSKVEVKESTKSGPPLYRFEVEETPKTRFTNATAAEHALVAERCAFAKQLVTIDGFPLYGGLRPARTAAWHKNLSTGYYLFQRFDLDPDGGFKVALPAIDKFRHDSALRLYSRATDLRNSASTLTWRVDGEIEGSTSSCRSVSALPLSLTGPDLVVAIVDGVSSEAVEVERDGIGALFLVEGRGLTFDASGLKPVRDDALEKKLETLRGRVKESIPTLIRRIEQEGLPALEVMSRRSLFLHLVGRGGPNESEALTQSTLQRLRYLSTSLRGLNSASQKR
ncbi:MAG: hypothetical protein KC800_14055 [Candidatus Eremiobacteraeota bacterium]|nr:hypothetical protein [Candidatus Eremiobacteraeota bacterium]